MALYRSCLLNKLTVIWIDAGSSPASATILNGLFVQWIRISVYETEDDGSSPSRPTMFLMSVSSKGLRPLFPKQLIAGSSPATDTILETIKCMMTNK